MYVFLATVLFSLASFYVGKAQGVQEGLKESKRIEQEVNVWLRSLSESDAIHGRKQKENSAIRRITKCHEAKIRESGYCFLYSIQFAKRATKTMVS